MFNASDEDVIDMFIFDVPSPEVSQPALVDFCNITTEWYVHGAINAVISDNDYSLIEGFYGTGLHKYVHELTNSAIHTVYEDEEAYDPEIVYMINNNQQQVYEYLYVSFLSMFNNFLIYIPRLFLQVRHSSESYRDYALSATGANYVLRLVRGIRYDG